jgi:magnesium-transporting ATPase (P-type)
MQVSTFVINYQGWPFRESLKDNKALYYGLVGVASVALFGATEFITELNEGLQLVPFPGDVSCIYFFDIDTYLFITVQFETNHCHGARFRLGLSHRVSY